MQDSSASPRSRAALCGWALAQWLVIPLALIGATAWNLIILFGDGQERDTVRAYTPLAWFVSPRRFVMEWSRYPQPWEQYVTKELHRLTVEITSERFSLRSKSRYNPRLKPVDDDRHYAYGVRVPQREYRGLAPSEVIRIAELSGLYAPHSAGRSPKAITLVARPGSEVRSGGR